MQNSLNIILEKHLHLTNTLNTNLILAKDHHTWHSHHPEDSNQGAKIQEPFDFLKNQNTLINLTTAQTNKEQIQIAIKAIRNSQKRARTVIIMDKMTCDTLQQIIKQS